MRIGGSPIFGNPFWTLISWYQMISNILAHPGRLNPRLQRVSHLSWKHDPLEAYNATADIWSLGITCIEMAFPAEFAQFRRIWFRICDELGRFLSEHPTAIQDIQESRAFWGWWCCYFAVELMFKDQTNCIPCSATGQSDSVWRPGRLSAAVLSHPANSGDVCDQYQAAHRSETHGTMELGIAMHQS